MVRGTRKSGSSGTYCVGLKQQASLRQQDRLQEHATDGLGAIKTCALDPGSVTASTLSAWDSGKFKLITFLE